MNTKPHQAALEGEQSLREAVRDEFYRKAKLGQYVVINRDGKPCRVPAEEALKEAEAGLKKHGQMNEIQ
jgi:hypothetical protein